MSKHTPGPWKVASHKTKHGENFSIHARKDGWCNILHGDRFLDQEKCPSVDEARANARLIAAAPDLLAACLAAKEWLDGWASAEPQLRVIGSAIAKAKGETLRRSNVRLYIRNKNRNGAAMPIVRPSHTQKPDT